MRMWWLERAADHDNIEYIFACEEGDKPPFGPDDALSLAQNLRIVTGNFGGSAPAWNAAHKESKGKVILQVSDDVEPPQGFDRMLLERIADLNKPTVIAVSDGYRKGAHGGLMTTAICTRAYCELEGHFICPLYMSMYSDDDFTIRAKAHAAAGEATLIDARDFVFLHRHAIHDRANVPWDATYSHTGSAEAYAHGLRLFNERNAAHIAAGLKTW